MKTILPLLFIALSQFLITGCESRSYLSFSEAEAIFEKGVTEERIIELYGEPNNTMDFDEFRTFYYDHEGFVESMEVGDEKRAFSIDFRDGVSHRIQEIIVTKR